MGANGSAFCNNLADTREEADYSSTCSPQMDRSDMEDEAEEGERNNEEEKETEEKEEEEEEEECTGEPKPVSQLDFYQADPFAHCQHEHDLFNEDLFPKTDTSDPFKGSDPFAADVLFPEGNLGTDEGAANLGDEGDTSLSCAENKASTGTQCFESEFPEEDSDIEISYSREDLDALATVDVAATDDVRGFKPIQSSSEEQEPEPGQGWRSQGQYSTESDPNGYELDLGAVSPPSDIEEHSLASLPAEAAAALEPGLPSVSAVSEPVLPNPDWTDHDTIEHIVPCEVTSCQGVEYVSDTEGEPQIPAVPQSSVDFQDHFVEVDSEQKKELSFELSYQASSQSSFDPYGFKLSPEHSSHDLLDPDEAELSPEPNDPDLTFESDPASPQPDQLDFDPYVFDITSSHVVRDSDPYGFKLSPDEENQEVLDLCDHNSQDEMNLCRFDSKEQVEPSDDSNKEVMEASTHDNQEVTEPCSHDNQALLDLWDNGNQEVLQPSSQGGLLDLVGNENQELELLSCENKEVLEPCYYSNQPQLEPCKYANQDMPEHSSHQELLDFSCYENQEVLDMGSHGNQELLDLGCDENQEVLDLSIHDNQEVLDLISKEIPEANNNNCDVHVSSTNNSSDSDQASEVFNVELLGLELSNATNNPSTANAINTAASTVSTSHSVLEDLSSVFGAGGYIACPDVADDLEPLQSRQVKPVAEPVRPVRPVRPPRPSLRGKEKPQSNTQGVDLK
ncbi:uncharacterized protein LOC142989124 isoform X2 [Genypterus blacodes]|uniref:uncharacterized protein LOC142989124 isoform X2 n=1 Tax=Genypterus blacodes TaxID=154954 RepID=UPI003F77176D